MASYSIHVSSTGFSDVPASVVRGDKVSFHQSGHGAPSQVTVGTTSVASGVTAASLFGSATVNVDGTQYKVQVGGQLQGAAPAFNLFSLQAGAALSSLAVTVRQDTMRISDDDAPEPENLQVDLGDDVNFVPDDGPKPTHVTVTSMTSGVASTALFGGTSNVYPLTNGAGTYRVVYNGYVLPASFLMKPDSSTRKRGQNEGTINISK